MVRSGALAGSERLLRWKLKTSPEPVEQELGQEPRGVDQVAPERDAVTGRSRVEIL